MGTPPADWAHAAEEPPDWSKYEWRDVPLENYPLLMTFPRFDLPGIVRGAEPTDSVSIRDVFMFIPNLPNVESGTIEAGTTFEPQMVPLGDFMRLLAKVAHGAAVAELGMNSFDPILTDLILGRSNYFGHYIGNKWWSSARTGMSKPLHRIRLEIRRGWLVGFVQLFANYHAPWYYVVVGKPKASLCRFHVEAVQIQSIDTDAFNSVGPQYSVKIVS
jgi:hypothetical protein